MTRHALAMRSSALSRTAARCSRSEPAARGNAEHFSGHIGRSRQDRRKSRTEQMRRILRRQQRHRPRYAIACGVRRRACARRRQSRGRAVRTDRGGDDAGPRRQAEGAGPVLQRALLPGEPAAGRAIGGFRASATCGDISWEFRYGALLAGRSKSNWRASNACSAGPDRSILRCPAAVGIRSRHLARSRSCTGGRRRNRQSRRNGAAGRRFQSAHRPDSATARTRASWPTSWASGRGTMFPITQATMRRWRRH